MDFSFSLRVFSIMLMMFSIMLGALLLQHDPIPDDRIIQIDALPRARWPSIVTWAGIAGLPALFVLLLVLCYVLLG